MRFTVNINVPGPCKGVYQLGDPVVNRFIQQNDRLCDAVVTFHIVANWEVCQHRDIMLLQVFFRAYSGKHQYLGRDESSCAEDDLL